MMKATLFSVLLFIPLLSIAQKVTVSKDQRTVKGNTGNGYATELAGSSESVNQALNRFLKDYGKTRTASGVITLSSPVLGGTTYEKNNAYAVVKGDAVNSNVWMGLVESEWPNHETDVLIDRFKDLVYQFGVKYYRDQIQEEINETQQALDAIDRKLQRLITQNKDLNGKILGNEEEKIRLEKATEENKNNHVILLQKLDANKISQDSVANAGAQIRKVLDAQKERQQKVN